MRKILFRGKRIDNGEWIEGIAFPHDNCGKVTMFRQNQGDGALEGVEVLAETVGQFTGVTDKNGKKIFSGDILEVHDLISLFDGCNSEEICYCGKVMYMDNQGMYVCEGNENGNALCALNLEECEVIGNIHDNPKLLNNFKNQ